MSKQAIRNLATAAVVTATTNSTGVDISDMVGNATILMNSSATGGAGQTSDVKIQHSDTLNGTYTDTGVAFAQVTNAGASYQLLPVSVDQFKRFIRVVTTMGGGSPTVTRAVSIIGVDAY